MTVNTFSKPQCKIYKHFSCFLYLIFPNQTIIEQLYVFLYYFIVIRFDWHAHYLGTMSGLNKVVLSCRKVPQKIFAQWQCIFYIYRQYNAFTQDETICMFIFSYLNIDFFYIFMYWILKTFWPVLSEYKLIYFIFTDVHVELPPLLKNYVFQKNYFKWCITVLFALFCYFWQIIMFLFRWICCNKILSADFALWVFGVFL